MKTFTLFIVSLLFTAGAFGQITINSGDFPSVGDHFVWATDEEPSGVAPGSPGANQNWDFTGLAEDFTSDAIFVNPSSTPFAANFPEATIATNTDDTVYSYMLKNSNKAAYLGNVIVGTSGDPLIFNIVPEELFASYPVNYLDEWDEEFYNQYYIATGQPGVDSMRFKSAREKEVVVDAWGTLTIPLGTYNVLRAKETEVSHDSTWFKIGGVWMLQFTSTDTYYYYEWWTNQSPVAPFIASMSSMDDFATVDDVTWVKDFLVGVDELSVNKGLGLYPNPAVEYLTIRTDDDSKIDNIKIINSFGQVIQRFEVEEKDVFKLDVSGFTNGIYYCVVNDTSNGSVRSGAFTVSR